MLALLDWPASLAGYASLDLTVGAQPFGNSAARLRFSSPVEDSEEDNFDLSRLLIPNAYVELHYANSEAPPIVIEEGNEVELFSVVNIARQVKRASVSRASRS